VRSRGVASSLSGYESSLSDLGYCRKLHGVENTQINPDQRMQGCPKLSPGTVARTCSSTTGNCWTLRIQDEVCQR
jgi:hypothetical protein